MGTFCIHHGTHHCTMRHEPDQCETCGDTATQWDYDQMKYLCDRHVEQGDFTVPLETMPAPSNLRAVGDETRRT